MMSLQYPSADHGQAIQPNLRCEHHDKCSQDVPTADTVSLGKDRGEESRAGEYREPGRGQHKQGPGDERRRGARSMLAPSRADVPGDDRHHHTGEDTPGHNLEEHVGQAVGGVVGVAEAGVSNSLGKDH